MADEPWGGEERRTGDRERAIEEGRRRERVDGRLNSHEARLNAINGSIDRGTRATNELRNTVSALHEEVSTLVADLKTRDAIEAERAEQQAKADAKRTEQVRIANEKQVSTRAFVIGVGLIVVSILVALYAKSSIHIGLILGGLW